MDYFGLTEDSKDSVQTYIGVVSLAMQGVGISLITAKFDDEASILRFSIGTLTVAYACLVRMRLIWPVETFLGIIKSNYGHVLYILLTPALK